MPRSSIISTPAFSSRMRMKPARSNIAWPSRSAGMEEHAVLGIGLDEARRRIRCRPRRIACGSAGRSRRRCRLRSAPSFSIASMVDSSTPVSAPFQPACAAPITRALGVDEQDRAAVRRRDRDRQALGARDERIRLRARGAVPRAGHDDHVGRMNLVHADQMVGRHAELRAPSAAGSRRPWPDRRASRGPPLRPA